MMKQSIEYSRSFSHYFQDYQVTKIDYYCFFHDVPNILVPFTTKITLQVFGSSHSAVAQNLMEHSILEILFSILKHFLFQAALNYPAH